MHLLALNERTRPERRHGRTDALLSISAGSFQYINDQYMGGIYTQAKAISNGATHPAPARPDGSNRTKTRPNARTQMQNGQKKRPARPKAGPNLGGIWGDPDKRGRAFSSAHVRPWPIWQ